MPSSAQTGRVATGTQRSWSLTERMLLVALAAIVLPVLVVIVAAATGDISGQAEVALMAVASFGGTAVLLIHLHLRLRPVDAACRRLRRFVNLGILEGGGPYPDDEVGRLLAQVDQVCLRLDDARLDAERAATVDHLTGALTRRATESEVVRLVREARRWDDHLSLALVDLDHFKAINDQLGHAAGDAALRHAVVVLQRSLRGAGFVGRWGGDELLVVVRGSGREAASGLDRVRTRIAERLDEVLGRRVTVSVGVAELRPHTTIAGCIAAADRALYLAKAQGRDQVVDSTAELLQISG